MTLVGEEIGGLERSMFSFGRRIARASHLPSYPFNKTDQDALNIAVMTADGAVALHSAGTVRWRRFTLAIGNAIGRFYRRS